MYCVFKNKHVLLALLVSAIICPQASVGQASATVKQYEKQMTTYPFSNPDPVPTFTHAYPYFRFDGFSAKSVQKKWKIVELANDYIKLLITPEIGAKIWTAINKKTGKAFIYNNDAVKFRDIALRGPWTSGGLEANFGIFGHTPGVATPVDYVAKQNADGSAECTIGLLDLLTQTRWRVKIILPKDKAYFITKTIWHNGSGTDQPYYTWMNLGIKVSDSLTYLEPGNHYLGHDGSVHSWPYDEHNHKHIAVYAQNDFGPYKSYHVTGVYSKYWGAYWQKEDAGMVHYSDRGDKIGKKVWIWGLSRQGMIWEKLLTDNSGQYSELQSGRLYNQNADNSLYSPFKQIGFTPYATDVWSEYWYPFQNTEGAIYADLNGVFNLKRKKDSATLYIAPVGFVSDTLKIWDENKLLVFKQKINLSPLQSFQQSFFINKKDSVAKIVFAGTQIQLQNEKDKILDRPLLPNKAFDWQSAYGLYTKGFYQARRHDYAGAEKSIDSSIQKDPGLLPALAEMALLQYHKLNYDSAFYFARKALSINTYSPKANYYYGLAALELNKRYDAADGFQVATITYPYRSAAYTELSKMYLQDKKYHQAFDAASKALETNTLNITAWQLKSISADKMKQKGLAQKIRNKILKLDPLNHFVRFENYWNNPTDNNRTLFTSLIRNELPQQTYLSLVSWYSHLRLNDRAEKLLELDIQKNDELLYWQAWLNRDNAMGTKYLAIANQGSPKMVFPFTAASASVMQWAMKETKNWKPRYFLALIMAGRNQKERALELLQSIQDTVGYAPLYVVRARLLAQNNKVAAIADFKKAASFNTADWRYLKYLTQQYILQKNYTEALHTIDLYGKTHPENYVAGLLYIQCLLLNNHYAAAEKILDKIHVLPFEGASEGHKYYKQTKMILALQAIEKHNYKAAKIKLAEALRWPERLGAGKPYDADIDTSLVDKMKEIIKQKVKLSKEALATLSNKILEKNK